MDSALRMSDQGISDRANANMHGVAIKTIRRWRRLYQRRGLPRGGSRPATPCPRCDGAELDEAAYALLLGWYLGDGSIARARRGVFTLQIVNDERYGELNREIAETIRRVKPTASPCLRGGNGAIRVEARWKHWPCVFPQHGAGRKHLRYFYVRYQFSNQSDDIRKILTEALDLLGIAWRQSRRDTIAVSRKEGVAVLDGFVGPKS
ncbi:hypothetical protein GCM10009804_09020 [Kribbella hippodromi]|uniref:DOD-type homing endonuclease domain-containing protein n=1 Tax=Kribbella hippodromi TaxID=434347 RepID=A0ABP4N456_9ACTN